MKNAYKLLIRRKFLGKFTSFMYFYVENITFCRSMYLCSINCLHVDGMFVINSGVLVINNESFLHDMHSLRSIKINSQFEEKFVSFLFFRASFSKKY